MDSLGMQPSFSLMCFNPLLCTSDHSFKLVLRDAYEPIRVIKTLPREVCLEVYDRGRQLIHMLGTCLLGVVVHIRPRGAVCVEGCAVPLSRTFPGLQQSGAASLRVGFVMAALLPVVGCARCVPCMEML